MKNLLGLIIALCTEVVGCLPLYAGMVIDFLTMHNVKSHKSPSGRALEPYVSGRVGMCWVREGNPVSPLFSQTDAVGEKTCHRFETARDRSIQTSFKKYDVVLKIFWSQINCQFQVQCL